MIIVEKNEGAKIPYETRKNKVTFDDDLTINLEKREEDFHVHIDVCYDEDQNLVIGAAAGRSYVAEIDIPGRSYTEEEVETTSVDGEAETGMEGPTTVRKAVPFDMSRVTLTLWAVC